MNEPLADELRKEVADQILALIEGERSEWKLSEEYSSYKGMKAQPWNTSCGKVYFHDYGFLYAPYCKGCGKRIEVKS